MGIEADLIKSSHVFHSNSKNDKNRNNIGYALKNKNVANYDLRSPRRIDLDTAIKALKVKKEEEFNHLDEYLKDCQDYSDKVNLKNVQKCSRAYLEDIMWNETGVSV